MIGDAALKIRQTLKKTSCDTSVSLYQNQSYCDRRGMEWKYIFNPTVISEEWNENISLDIYTYVLVYRYCCTEVQLQENPSNSIN